MKEQIFIVLGSFYMSFPTMGVCLFCLTILKKYLREIRVMPRYAECVESNSRFLTVSRGELGK